MTEQFTVIQIISISILPILFAIIGHEAAHGFVAYLLGDKTPRVLGRLTLNPVKHIDILGTIIIPVALLLFNTGIIFGWAKPVPINSLNFRKPRRDLELVALAGPVANFIMAFFWAAIAKISVILLLKNFPGALAINAMSKAGIGFNLMLMVFNLLPIPPLDGSHIIAGIMPLKMAIRYEQVAPYGFFILLILLYVGVINTIVGPAINFLYGLLGMIFNL